MQDKTLINGLLAKREELQRENAELRERMAILANDIDALDRVLASCGYRGELVGSTPRQARIVLFYRNELREYLWRSLGRLTGRFPAAIWPVGSANARAKTRLTGGFWRTLRGALGVLCGKCERRNLSKVTGTGPGRRFGGSQFRSAIFAQAGSAI